MQAVSAPSTQLSPSNGWIILKPTHQCQGRGCGRILSSRRSITVQYICLYLRAVYLSICMCMQSIYLSICVQSIYMYVCCLPGAVLRHATASQPCQPSRPQKAAHAAHARAPAVGRQTRRTLADALTAAPTHRAVAPVPCSRARRPTTKARRPARVPGHARPKVLGLCVPCTVLGCSSA